MHKNLNLNYYEAVGKKKLQKAKRTLKLIVLDFDGTLTADDTEYDFCSALSVIKDIIQAGCNLAIISARAASGFKLIVQPIQELLKETNLTSVIFFAGGNGTILYRITPLGFEQIFNFGLSQQIINKIIENIKIIYNKTNYKLDQRGINIFFELNKIDWQDIISEDILKIRKTQPEYCFVEDAKVSIVLPRNRNDQEKLINEIKNHLRELHELQGEELKVSCGDTTFAHITKTIQSIDPKQFALEKIMQQLRISKQNVVVIGDMPEGNDKGMLVDSGFPYTFTNDEKYVEQRKVIDCPPFFLPNLTKKKPDHPVGRVHNAIEYLLGVNY